MGVVVTFRGLLTLVYDTERDMGKQVGPTRSSTVEIVGAAAVQFDCYERSRVLADFFV